MSDTPQKPPLIQKIRLENILSFGEPMELELKPLNVLIGPNGSGKSNLIDIFGLLKATTFSPETRKDPRTFVSRRGGASEWIWKGNYENVASVGSELQFYNSAYEHRGTKQLVHKFNFTTTDPHFYLDSEDILCDGERIWHQQGFDAKLRIRSGSEWVNASKRPGTFSSILDTQLDYDHSEIRHIRYAYNGISIYKDWVFGAYNSLRQPVRTDIRGDVLDEDYSNLFLYLNNVTQDPKLKRRFIEGARKLYDSITDLQFPIVGGMVHLAFVEGDFSIPASRLSDGTLRYLSLLAILLSPSPPPLVCLEEPELGLHPDILPGLADLLVEASTRTQLIVTTHSDILVGALTDHAESIVVCEKHDGQTQMHRLTQEEVAPWLDKYRLGELWLDGEIGGKRW